jgi:hypothetical protein
MNASVYKYTHTYNESQCSTPTYHYLTVSIVMAAPIQQYDVQMMRATFEACCRLLHGVPLLLASC